jgi:hypothetical protein
LSPEHHWGQPGWTRAVVGKVVSHYKITAKLGEGGMGEAK